jgi:tetratricopeptide (TPR) repeat protein
MGISDYQSSLRLVKKAMAINEAAHLDWHTLAATLTLAEAHRGLGDYQAAIEVTHKALKNSTSSDNRRFLSFGCNTMAMIYLDLNLQKKAEELYLQAIEHAEEANTFWWIPAIQAGLAISRLRRGNLAVESDLQEALVNSRQRRQILHSTPCLQGLVELAIAQGQQEKAMDYADELLALAEAGQMQEWRFQALRGRCLAYSAMGQKEAAEQAIEQATEVAQAINSPRLSWEKEKALGQLSRDSGDAFRAEQHEAEATTIMESMWLGLDKKMIATDLFESQDNNATK